MGGIAIHRGHRDPVRGQLSRRLRLRDVVFTHGLTRNGRARAGTCHALPKVTPKPKGQGRRSRPKPEGPRPKVTPKPEGPRPKVTPKPEGRRRAPRRLE